MGFYGPMGPAGFRRRGRRRGLVIGTTAGSSIASRRQQRQADAATPKPKDVRDNSAK